MEDKLGCAGSLSSEAPDADVIAFQGVACRGLDLEDTLGGHRAGPFVPERETDLDDIAVMGGDGLVALGSGDDNTSFRRLCIGNYIAGAAASSAEALNRRPHWGGGCAT